MSNFIIDLNNRKQVIENRHTRAFKKLYKRIGNDLINILQRQSVVNFKELFQNYKPDYIYLFRNIYQDVHAEFGFDLRKKIGFNKSNQIQIKSITVSEQNQTLINEIFDDKYTTLLNNRTEELADDGFIESEAKYFQNTYEKSIKNTDEFLTKQKENLAKINTEILSFVISNQLTRTQEQRLKVLNAQKQAVEKQISNIENNKRQEINKTFKTNLEKNIEIRSQSSSQYGTGQATSEVRELEYQAIKDSNVTITKQNNNTEEIVALALLIKRMWWEKSRFILGATPRDNHVALSGTVVGATEYFNVAGYQVQRPRDPTLPPEESVRCRCEIEYII